MADCFINLLKEVGKCIWLPLEPHFDYWWCFDGNVQGLRDEIRLLERERSNMDQKIEEARLRAESATTEVKDWLNKGTRKLEEAKGILQGCDNINKWNMIRRYSVGKNTKETAKGIAKLREEGNSIRIADPAPPAAMVPITNPPTLEFQSRKHLEEDIMKFLTDDNVPMIAVCGVGGVGKTTMVKRIVERVRKEFDEIVTVVVSQQTNKLKIQKQIAGKLGLGLSEDTLDVNAHKLSTRLMDSKKKLIIFDDVWERLELEDIGVPYGRCKIILTSRIKDVCEEMEAHKVIEIQVLDKEEAWTLFGEICRDDLSVRHIAREVAEKCKGLPIALVTVGKALQNRRMRSWKYALSQMRKANPIHFRRVLKNVYMPLKLSYDFLENKIEKDLFLLCSLFPEEYNIQIEDLALLSIGLRLFGGNTDIEEGRNRTYHLLEILRNHYLLMTGSHEDEVKMHDVLRDVAIYIGSTEKEGFLNVCSMDLSSEDSSRNCNWLSVDISIANAKLPIEQYFPNLRLLMILNSKKLEFPEGFDVNNVRFQVIEELTVLYLSYQNLNSLPSSLEFLKKLRKLHLHRCEVKDICVVGKLASLEILRILGCNSIEELPANVGELKYLRLLELRDCEKLKRILAVVISSSVGLEELKIVACGTIEPVLWNEMESNIESSIKFPKLKKLKLCNLPNLLDFTQGVEIIKIPHLIEVDIKQCPKLRTKIDNYATRMIMIEKLEVRDCDAIEEIFRDDGNRHLTFQELRELRLEDLPCLTTFYRGVESIKFPNLKELTISNLPRLNSFVEIEDSEPTRDHHSLHFFCNKKVEMIGLETLYLWRLRDKISKIWCPHIPISFFHNLQSIDIHYVDGIRNLISSSIAKSLINLKNLLISHCKEMVDVIEDETHEPVNSVFSNLKSLKITDNCKLTSFCQWKYAFELPSLEEVEIVNCSLMKTFTLKSLSTPKLHRFSINNRDIEMKDLNVGLQHFTSTEMRTIRWGSTCKERGEEKTESIFTLTPIFPGGSGQQEVKKRKRSAVDNKK